MACGTKSIIVDENTVGGRIFNRDVLHFYFGFTVDTGDLRTVFENKTGVIYYDVS